jgi:hypothetical protein
MEPPPVSPVGEARTEDPGVVQPLVLLLAAKTMHALLGIGTGKPTGIRSSTRTRTRHIHVPVYPRVPVGTGTTTGQTGLDGYSTRNGYTPGYARQTMALAYGLEQTSTNC